MRKPIYPDVEMRRFQLPDRAQIEMNSYLRMKHEDGKWYLTRIYSQFDERDAENEIKQFYRQVYICQQLGIVVPDAEYPEHFGKPGQPFTLDENQESEQERLPKKYNLWQDSASVPKTDYSKEFVIKPWYRWWW